MTKEEEKKFHAVWGLTNYIIASTNWLKEDALELAREKIEEIERIIND